MDVVRDGSIDKRVILNEISRCLKTVFTEASSSAHNSVNLSLNSPLIQSVDRSLQHGLVNLVHGYWPLVRTFCHAQTLHSLDNSVGVQGSHRSKAQAWLLFTLAEGTLLSYLQCILAEPRAVDRLYAPHAILRDPSCVAQLSSLLTGLESINILVENSIDLKRAPMTCSGAEENVKPILDLPLNGGPGLSGAMTSSMTSSLASPGDSGFTQLDSETDTASFSEIVLDPDCTSVKEDIAVLPIDPCSEKTVGNSSMSEPMTVSDIANANIRLGILNSDTSDGCVDWPSADDVVYRKHKSIKGKSSDVKQQKRVSFHDSTPDIVQYHEESETPEKDTMVLGHSIRSSASHLSRAVVDLSSFEYEQEGVEIAKDLSILGNAGIEELSVNTQQISSSSNRVESTQLDVKCSSLRQTYQYSSEKAPVAERGTPEGQEDPPHRCSISTTVSDPSQIMSSERLRMSNSSPVPSCSSLRPQVSSPQRQLNNYNTSFLASSTPNSTSVLSQAPSKACLVNRFLRSITEKKISNRRSEAAFAAFKRKALAMRKLNLYIHEAKPDDELSYELEHELETEMSQFFSESSGRLSDSGLTLEIASWRNFFCNHLGLSSNESVLKVLKMRGTSVNANGTRVPLIVVLTDTALYVLDQKLIKHSVTLHSSLSSILVGPNSQWISLISSEKSFQVDLLVSGSNCVSEFIISLELALRRRHGRNAKLPVVIHLLYEEFFAIPQWMPVLQGEEVYHYSVVHAIEEMPGLPCSPSDLDMQAYFMFKKCENNSACAWEPGYFVLKNNILYVSSDEETLPWHTLNLQGIECRIISLASRPHIIEVGILHIAAPDNFVAKDWLAAFQKASTTHEPAVPGLKPNFLSGSLVLTESRLMLISTLGIPKNDLDKPAKPSLTAFVTDVSSVKIGGKDSCWCVLEFACREVHESGGDYIIFFSTSSEMLSFRENIRKLSPILDQGNSLVLQKETLQSRCNEMSAALSNGWSIEEHISSLH
ncbi:uncharacterized protein LOC117642578 [Thrips palmi]|uniref:Uncharacterized protein LOC117642578 n=1 Tax=Thrips palmi TaxID=161013 RepID=A0A6P8YID8_THRPL|nr:uncharacterized protein LOC117642578 [Thrips palmi]